MANLKSEVIQGLRRTNSNALDVLVDSVKLYREDAPVELTSSAYTGHTGTLTEGAHAGKILIAPDHTANGTINVPAPSRAGVRYRLVYGGVADDAHNLTIALSTTSNTFSGGIFSSDENQAGATQVAVEFRASGDDKMHLTAPHAFDIELISTSTTNFLVTGYAVSDDHVSYSAS